MSHCASGCRVCAALPHLLPKKGRKQYRKAHEDFPCFFAIRTLRRALMDPPWPDPAPEQQLLGSLRRLQLPVGKDKELDSGDRRVKLAISIARAILPPALLQPLAEVCQAAWQPQHVKQHAQPQCKDQQRPLQLPDLMQGSFTRTLLEWLLGHLARACSGSAAQQSQGSSTSPPAPHLDARLWALTTCLVQSGLVADVTASLPANLATAMSAACNYAASKGATGSEQDVWQAAALLEGVASVLKLVTNDTALPASLLPCTAALALHQRGLPPWAAVRSPWQPTLEQAALLVMAATQGHTAVPSHTGPGASDQAHCSAAAASLRLSKAQLCNSLLALRLLVRLVDAHPAPRKVFTLALSVLQKQQPGAESSQQQQQQQQDVAQTLLGQLLLLGWPPGGQSQQGGQPAGVLAKLRADITSAARGLVDSITLHSTHIPGLVDVASHLAAPHLVPATPGPQVVDQQVQQTKATKSKKKVKPSALPGTEPEADNAGADADKGDQVPRALRSYHAQLVTALGDCISGNDVHLRQAALSWLPHLLTSFHRTVQRLRQAAAAEAAAAARVALQGRGSRRQDEREEEGGQEGEQGLMHMAEFHMLVALVGMLTQLAQQALARLDSLAASQAATQSDGGPRKKARVSQEVVHDRGGSKAESELDLVAASARGVASLLSSSKNADAYQPTRDLQQTQRKFLTSVADSLFTQLDAVQQQQAGSWGTGRGTAQGVLHVEVGLARALGAMLDLEHRAVSSQLERMWSLLWSITRADLAAPSALVAGPSQQSVTSLAASAAARMVVAYSELRQLETLLGSLLAALVPVSSGAGDDLTQEQQQQAAASLLVTHPRVLTALTTAVAHLPPGQCAPLITFLTRQLGPQGELGRHLAPDRQQQPGEGDEQHQHRPSSMTTATLLAASTIATTCMKALRVELTTAKSLAEATQQLLSSGLAGHLVAHCSRAATAIKKGKHHKPRHAAALAALLSMYAEAIRLHATCSSLHPGVTPLPGVDVWVLRSKSVLVDEPDVNAAPHEQQDDAAGLEGQAVHGPAAGYFGAALAAVEPQARHKLGSTLRKAATAAGGGEEGDSGCGEPLAWLMRYIMLPALCAACSKGADSTDTGRVLPSDGGEVAQSALALAVYQCGVQHASILTEQLARLRSLCLHPAMSQEQHQAAEQARCNLEQECLAEAQHLVAMLLDLFLGSPRYLATGSRQARDLSQASQCSSAPAALHNAALLQALARLPVSVPANPFAAAAAYATFGGEKGAGQAGGKPPAASALPGVWMGALGVVSRCSHLAEEAAVRAVLSSVLAATYQGGESSATLLGSLAGAGLALLKTHGFASLPAIRSALPGVLASHLSANLLDFGSTAVGALSTGSSQSSARHKKGKHSSQSDAIKSALIVVRGAGGQDLRAAASAVEGLLQAQVARAGQVSIGKPAAVPARTPHSLTTGAAPAAGEHQLQQVERMQQLLCSLITSHLRLSDLPSEGLLHLHTTCLAGLAVLVQVRQMLGISSQGIKGDQVEGEQKSEEQQTRLPHALQQTAVRLLSALGVLQRELTARASLDSVQLSQKQHSAAAGLSSKPVLSHLPLTLLLDWHVVAGKLVSGTSQHLVHRNMHTLTMLYLLESCNDTAAKSRTQAAGAGTGSAQPPAQHCMAAALDWAQAGLTQAPATSPSGAAPLPAHSAAVLQGCASFTSWLVGGEGWLAGSHLAGLPRITLAPGGPTKRGRKQGEAGAAQLVGALEQRLGALNKLCIDAALQLRPRQQLGTDDRAAGQGCSSSLAQAAAEVMSCGCALLQLAPSSTSASCPASARASRSQLATALHELLVSILLPGQHAALPGAPAPAAASSSSGAAVDAGVSLLGVLTRALAAADVDDGAGARKRHKALGQDTSSGRGDMGDEGEDSEAEHTNDTNDDGADQLTAEASSGGRTPATSQLASTPDLLSLHVELLEAWSPCGGPPHLSSSTSGTLMGPLLSDLDRGSPAWCRRYSLITSLMSLLKGSPASDLQAVLSYITSHLATGQTLAVTPAFAPVQEAQQLVSTNACEHQVALLRCLLVALESQGGGPRLLRVLSASASSLVPVLAHRLPVFVSQLNSHSATSSVPVVSKQNATQTASALASAAVLCLRCLQTMAARVQVFEAQHVHVPSIVAAAACVAQHLSAPAPAPEGGCAKELGAAESHGVLCAAASLLADTYRHKGEAARACMPLYVQAMRGLLVCTMHWAMQQSVHGAHAGQQAAGHLTSCAHNLARVYDAIVEDKSHHAPVRKYVSHMLADYITTATVTAAPQDLSAGDAHGTPLAVGATWVLPPAASSLLRRSALSLVGALGPAELQALHAALGSGPLGGARRSVLQALRKEWQSHIKYTGKV